ncbi:RluA family pseudouridine synthase [Streptococcus zalophi]|uniref:RluA family pseudouridine synthase n=1 Tax=Streptococcus zalophi TaxID=640031 RepID=UPI00215D1252|nr:RluA family pseudouridine synthase [Streptococcus zalophi]MCR8968219.1 RluA family pseudouridine synthase [Streptococcus zalophi]
MTMKISFKNHYGKVTVKELLEEKCLIPRKIRHFLRMKKHVLVNGKSVHWQEWVEKEDHVLLLFDEEDYPEKTIPFGQEELVDCLYEDEHLIIVNKPEGMKTHGNEPTEIALLNHVSAFVGQTCYVIHRLDMETSGLVMFAKNPFILPILNRLLEQKKIKRDYLALVTNHFPEKRMTFKDKIGRHRHDRRKRVVDERNGRTALTTVEPLQYFPKTTLVRCQLETGRTHQIRVHLAHHHYPIVGDPLYHPNQPYSRLMLHAYQLDFRHPLTLETISIKSDSETFQKGLA